MRRRHRFRTRTGSGAGPRWWGSGSSCGSSSATACPFDPVVLIDPRVDCDRDAHLHRDHVRRDGALRRRAMVRARRDLLGLLQHALPDLAARGARREAGHAPVVLRRGGVGASRRLGRVRPARDRGHDLRRRSRGRPGRADRLALRPDQRRRNRRGRRARAPGHCDHVHAPRLRARFGHLLGGGPGHGHRGIVALDAPARPHLRPLLHPDRLRVHARPLLLARRLSRRRPSSPISCRIRWATSPTTSAPPPGRSTSTRSPPSRSGTCRSERS